MSNLHLVTGYAGAAHITPEDHGSLYAAIFGNGSYVLDRGKKLSASAITSNQVRVLDGDMVIQGRHVRIAANTYVDLTIENGAQGVYRNDLIVARYTKNSSTGIEECNLVVIKGTAAASDPQDPEYTTGDILGGGDAQHDFPLYRVPLNGLTVGDLVPLFSVSYLVTLGSDGKVPADYLPAMNYISASQKGAANGVATLGADKMIPAAQFIKTGNPTGMTALDNSCQVSLWKSDSYWVQIGKLVVLYLYFSCSASTETADNVSATLTGVPAPVNKAQGLWTPPLVSVPMGIVGLSEDLKLVVYRNGDPIGTSGGMTSATLVYFTDQ